MSAHWETGRRGDLSAFATVVTGDPEVPLAVRCEDGVATFVLDRPDRHNALTRRLSAALLEGLVHAGADRSVRCVVLTSSGASFCTGDDVSSVQQWRLGDRSAAPFDPLTHDADYLRICEEMLHLPKPVVAAVAGPTAGAGTEIACAADYRIAASTATFGSRLLQVGHVGNVVLLSRVVGPARATQIYLTGRMVPATEALQIGLVDEVVPPEVFAESAAACARRMAELPTRSVGLFKELRERTWGQPVEYGLRMQDAYHLRTHDEVRDAAEGMTAFIERRTPHYDGR